MITKDKIRKNIPILPIYSWIIEEDMNPFWATKHKYNIEATLQKPPHLK